jgi:hypothetical protein
MKIVTYSTDPTWHARYVLAVVQNQQLVVRIRPLSAAQLKKKKAFVRDAARLLSELNQKTPAEVATWVRYQGLSVGLEEVEDQPPEVLFARPLPPKHDLAAIKKAHAAKAASHAA